MNWAYDSLATRFKVLKKQWINNASLICLLLVMRGCALLYNYDTFSMIKVIYHLNHVYSIRVLSINQSGFLVCRLHKLLSWFFTQTFVVNFRYYMFCLCNVRRQYLLPGILGIYCFLTCVPSLPAIALPKGRICSLVNQVYTSFPLMSLPPFGLHWPNVG